MNINKEQCICYFISVALPNIRMDFNTSTEIDITEINPYTVVNC